MGTTILPLHRVNIFITSGFEEDFVMHCTAYFQNAGVPISLLGVKAGEVVGANGVGVCPDYFLDFWRPSSKPQLLILPGGTNTIKEWMVEPRLFRIVQHLLDNRGLLALAKGSERIFRSGFLKVHPTHASKILIQNEMTNEEFIHRIYRVALRKIPNYPTSKQILRKRRPLSTRRAKGLVP